MTIDTKKKIANTKSERYLGFLSKNKSANEIKHLSRLRIIFIYLSKSL